jgi:hypothetical protein
MLLNWRILRHGATWLLLLAGTHILADEKHSGSACSSCHAAQSSAQFETPMGRALQPPGSDATLASHRRMTFQKWGYTYVVETQAGRSVYSVSDGTQTISLPIGWTFGYGAKTWVFEKDGGYYGSRVSYYPSIDGLEVTTGEQNTTPRSLDEAVGRELNHNEPKDCFGCHSTGATSNGYQLKLDHMEPGVTCEHCHVGANAHMVAAFQGDEYYSAPPDLKQLSSEDISNFCGQCHRTWETVVRSQWRGEVDVRFQPFRLANSKCFNGTDPRISCIACHDPHRNLVTDEASYDVKCLACHRARNGSITKSTERAANACPVATSNCASCHMPKVKLPNGLMTFHDHEIRIVKPGEPYPD